MDAVLWHRSGTATGRERFFDQTDLARRLEPIDLPFRRALAAWLVDYYEHDPIILARVVKNEVRRRAKTLPILHPHGFLPRKGDVEECQLVFTEDDYHGLTTSVFHWALTSIVNYLRHNTVLFIGLSMLDPDDIPALLDRISCPP